MRTARRPRARISVAAVSLLLIAAMLSAAASAEAAGWLEPQDISAANEVLDGRPEVAVDPAGNAVATWERHAGGLEVVEVSERPAGGEWSAPQRISLPGETGKRSQVAIDAAGTAVAAWVSVKGGGEFEVRSAARPAGGAWSEPESVSGTISEAVPPLLAIDAGSEAVAVWNAFTDNRVLQGAIRSAAGEWSQPEDLSEAGENVGLVQDSIDAAIDAAGTAVAVWTRESDGVIQAAVRPADGAWGEPEELSDASAEAAEPSVAINGGGAAVAAWRRYDGSDVIQAAVRPAAGTWSEPDDLSVGADEAGQPAVAIDADGTAVAVWHRDDGTAFVVQAALRSPGGAWGEPDDLSIPGKDASHPVVAINGAVGAVAMWHRSDGTDLRVQAAVRGPGGPWSFPDTISAAGEEAGFPQLGLDAAGNAIAVFGRSGQDGPIVQATGYDFVAPQLSNLVIPSAGIAGQPLAFSVSVADLFPTTTTWTFGDGAGATGNSPSHTYDVPGVYPVEVRAVDAGGNTTTHLGAIAVTAPAEPRPPAEPRQPLALSLRIEGKPLRRLKRSGKLRVVANLDDAATVTLRARAKRKGKLISVFAPKTVRFNAAGERKVTLALTKNGRKALRSLSKVRLQVRGEARGDSGTTAAVAARTLR